MKKRFEMENLDCAVCAGKMEEAIKKIDGVKDCGVNFLTQTITLEADDERFDEILRAAGKACAKVDADCRILY